MADVVFMDKVILREEKARKSWRSIKASGSLQKCHEPHCAPFICRHEMQGGSCEIYLHGGHITGWRTADGKVCPRQSS